MRRQIVLAGDEAAGTRLKMSETAKPIAAIPAQSRQKIHRALTDAGTKFQVRTYDAEHTFMRDQGARWEPRAADAAFRDVLSVLTAA